MARSRNTLQFFENDSDSNNSSGSLQFFDDWVKETKPTKQSFHSVSTIRKVRSNKGYILETEDFLIFLWSNQKLTKMLLEALDVYLDNPEKGYEIVVVVSGGKKPKYQIAADKEQRVDWFASTKKDKYTILGDLSDLEEKENPFL